MKQFSDFASLNIVSDIKLDGVALLITLFFNKCLSCRTKFYAILIHIFFDLIFITSESKEKAKIHWLAFLSLELLQLQFKLVNKIIWNIIQFL